MLTKSSAPGGQEPPSENATPSDEHRHRERRFHYHPEALGRGSLFRGESAPGAPESDNPAPQEPTPEQPSEREQAHRVAQNGLLLCTAILLLGLVISLWFNSSPESWKHTINPLILAGLAVAFFGVVLFDKFVRLLQQLRPK
jgi:hypothetical protein